MDHHQTPEQTAASSLPADRSYPFLSPPDRPGDLGRLGDYRVIRLLGEGGMGFVFLAEDDKLERLVALKVMRPLSPPDPTAEARFLREGRAAAAIKSDHVITIHQVGAANGVPLLAMEYLEGQNLDEWLNARQSPVTAEDVVWVARDVLNGLWAAHDRGLIHRDIKPTNLWVETRTNRIKLLDFGLTRKGGTDRGLTQTGQILGTPAYMAPEQARGRGVDARADLFSLGVVLHRMLSGQSPFQRSEVFATLIALGMDEAPAATSFGVLPLELANLIDRLLSKSPDGRPASAKEALAVVLEVAGRLPVRPAPPGPAAPVTAPAPGDRYTLTLPGNVPMVFAWCPPGSFEMGSNHPKGAENERPVHTVTLTKGFYPGIHAVTRGVFARFVAESNYQTEAETGGGGYKWTGTEWEKDAATTWRNPGFAQTDDHPVTVVSWNDAQAFAFWLKGVSGKPVRLLSEAEWEYACRAGTTTEYHFGDQITPDQVNYDGNHPWNGAPKGVYRQQTTPVGSFPANTWGLFDTHGNVWEWCQDVYAPYDAADQVDPVAMSEQSNERRVLRGGSWNYAARDCRRARRGRNSPVLCFNNVGFRVCVALD